MLELVVPIGSAEAVEATLQNLQITWAIAMLALMKTKLKLGRSLWTPTVSYLITVHGKLVR